MMSKIIAPTNDTSKPATGKVYLFLRILRAVFPILLTLNVRKVVIEEIRKVLNCRNPENGCLYYCEHCNDYKYVPFTCKSRFCPSCGCLYNKQRASSIAEHILNVPHRHIVFTIPEQLRSYFRTNRQLLDVLFQAAKHTFLEVMGHTFKGHINCGIICALHTFSRSSEWNPHIHAICTEGLFTDWGKWYPRPFISYDDLNITWQKKLLALLQDKIGPSFAPIAEHLRTLYPNGFVVTAGQTPEHYHGDVKQLIKYVARYLGRPCIGMSRIDSFDGKTVKFHYMKHVGQNKPDQYTKEELPVLEFVLRLSDHIQDPNFVNLRYYGLYSSTGLKSNCMTLIHKAGIKWLYSHSPASCATRHFYSHWRGAMMRSFGVDPVVCTHCGKVMEPLFYKLHGKIYMDIKIKDPRNKQSPSVFYD